MSTRFKTGEDIISGGGSYKSNTDSSSMGSYAMNELLNKDKSGGG
jgi:hypothetical protein